MSKFLIYNLKLEVTQFIANATLKGQYFLIEIVLVVALLISGVEP
jgi:hypothetical protein